MVRYFSVADFTFALEMPSGDPLWGTIGAYEPFEVEAESCKDIMFRVEVAHDDVGCEREFVLSNGGDESKMVKVDIYREKGESQGSRCYIFEIFHPQQPNLSSMLRLRSDFSGGVVVANGDLQQRLFVLNNALILSFMSAGLMRDAIFFHASVVTYRGCGYLFLGRSGTGKSTHSQMWMRYNSEVELLNDDHPIVRILDSGEVSVYGSPWSGKTSCYRNMSAPVGGVIRIKQASENRLKRLGGVASYASLTTSASMFNWCEELNDVKSRLLNRLISRVSCWQMEALPNIEAAQVAMEGVVCADE